MADVTAPESTRAGVCIVRAEEDGPGCLRITVTAVADVEDDLPERSSATTSIVTAIGRVQDFLEAFARRER
ncbi:MAG TPA: hypothetical protein VD834_09905 [Blastococcus sp.]|jgi:hypothetical protein|nr:hypothetical protein [Blastococcus sp.]